MTKKKDTRFKKGHIPWNKGKHLSEEHKENFRKAALKRKDIPKTAFKKGHIPWNKGQKMPDEIKEKIKKTMFKKGHKVWKSNKIGDEVVNKNGYVRIKIADPNVWKLKQRYLYEKYHNVELTSKDIIIFADGNRRNFDKDNLIKINRKEMMELLYQGLYKRDKDLTATGVNLVKLILAIRERKKNE